MVESGVGRTERSEVGERRGEPRALPEPDDGEVREPRPPVALVHAQPLEPLVEVARERGGAAVLVVEHEHADAPRLAVPHDGEASGLGGRGGFAQRTRDRRSLLARPATEERQRDVEVRADDAADADPSPLRKRASAPRDEPVQDVVRKTKGAEEPERRIAPHATGRIHTRSGRACVISRRTRWSAETVARRRIVSRSAGRLKPPSSSPSGLTACRYTSPTGFSAVPPPGPATPVTDAATSTPSRSRTPRAMARAVSADTAPKRASISAGTPSSRSFTSSA